MKKIHAVIVVIAAVVLVIAFLYLTDVKKSIFTEKLGDMTLTKYETGDAAATEIPKIPALRDIPLAQGYYAVYSGRSGAMRMWVAEPPDHNIANDAFNSMNSMLGGSTGHEEHEYSGDVGQTESHSGHSGADMASGTKAVKMDFIEFEKPDVYMLKINDVYNYYYFKMSYSMGRIYWISFDSPAPDMDYQLSVVKQAVMDI